MLNVRNLIVDTYQMLGHIADNESLDGTRTNVGLQQLNEVVAQMNLKNYFAFTSMSHEHAVTESKKEITVGVPTTSSDVTDVNIVRPCSITRLYIKTGNSVLNEVRQVSLQDLPMFERNGGGIPSAFSYQSTYPYAKIVLDIKPTSNHSLIICYNEQLPIFKINDVAAIPYEYETSLKYSLAYILAKRYGDAVETVEDMRRLRNESIDLIEENTVRKSEAVLHAGNESFNNIYSVRY